MSENFETLTIDEINVRIDKLVNELTELAEKHGIPEEKLERCMGIRVLRILPEMKGELFPDEP